MTDECYLYFCLLFIMYIKLEENEKNITIYKFCKQLFLLYS